MASTLTAVPTDPVKNRTVRIEILDNGFVVSITDGGPDYKEARLVFPGQAAMLKAVKEATSVERKE